MNWKSFFKGIGNAALNGVIGGVAPVAYNWATSAASGQVMQMPSGQTVGFMAAGFAILGVLNYLEKSPLGQNPTQ